MGSSQRETVFLTVARPYRELRRGRAERGPEAAGEGGAFRVMVSPGYRECVSSVRWPGVSQSLFLPTVPRLSLRALPAGAWLDAAGRMPDPPPQEMGTLRCPLTG